MLCLGFLVLLIGTVSAGPGPPPITRQELEEFKAFLEKIWKDDVSLDEVIAANLLAEFWENSGKLQDDVILDDDQVEFLLQDLALGKNSKWQSNNIVHEFGVGADEYIMGNTNDVGGVTATMMMMGQQPR